jgi:hypothetical protein
MTPSPAAAARKFSAACCGTETAEIYEKLEKSGMD